MIDFSGYTKAEIQRQMLEQVPNILDKREGSIIQTAIGPVAWYLEGLYMSLDKIQRNAYASTAVSESLDLIVADRGLERTQATPAVRQGTFDAQIPEGSQFKTINGADSIIFVSGELISAEDETRIYELTCSVAGDIGNNYTGPILPISNIPDLTTATIGSIITAGTDEESDDALRTRYFNTFKSEAFGGNITAYRNAILAIGGVGAVQIYPANQYLGGGTVLCSILGTDLQPAEPTIVENVQNIICPSEDGGDTPSPNGYGMAPIGAAVKIVTGTALTLNITCNMEFDPSVTNGEETYMEQIREQIQGYLNEVCADWGAPLYSHKVEYNVEVYVSRIIYAVLQIPQILNMTNVLINGSGDDLVLTETAELQQVPVLGTVTINGGS